MTTSTKLSIWAGVLVFAGIAAIGAVENSEHQDIQNKLQKQEKTLLVQAKRDRQLINTVEDKLAKHGLTKTAEIDVRVYKGVAYLSGFASNEKDRLRAINIVEHTPGLMAVNSRDLRHVIDLPVVVVKPGNELDTRELVAAR